MPRTLPWVVSSTRIAQRKDNNQNEVKRNTSLDISRAATSSYAKGKRSKSPETSVSASQRPQSLPSCHESSIPPTPEKFRPGLDRDDIYIMVEDEFLAVAQTFTRHLHRAEYERLQGQAGSRIESRKIQSRLNSNACARVSGVSTCDVSAKPKSGNDIPPVSQSLQISKQRHPQQSDDEDLPWKGTRLQGLMAPGTREKSRTAPTRAVTTRRIRQEKTVPLHRANPNLHQHSIPRTRNWKNERPQESTRFDRLAGQTTISAESSDSELDDLELPTDPSFRLPRLSSPCAERDTLETFTSDAPLRHRVEDLPTKVFPEQEVPVDVAIGVKDDSNLRARKFHQAQRRPPPNKEAHTIGEVPMFLC